LYVLKDTPLKQLSPFEVPNQINPDCPLNILKTVSPANPF